MEAAVVDKYELEPYLLFKTNRLDTATSKFPLQRYPPRRESLHENASYQRVGGACFGQLYC